MPVTNRYGPSRGVRQGGNTPTSRPFSTSTNPVDPDRDSSFGENKNRDIERLNRIEASQNGAAGVTNSYNNQHGQNQFGASSRFSLNEQILTQSMVSESIEINGITVKYLRRQTPELDVFNEDADASFYDSDFNIAVLIESAQGFEGEGDVFSSFGLEIREEIIFRMSIETFNDEMTKVNENNRKQPLEGDIIVVPFGRSGNSYQPKYFEILRVTTYEDGAFFQLGDNFQYRIQCRLFEQSGEVTTAYADIPDETRDTTVITDFRIDSEQVNIRIDSDYDFQDPFAQNDVIEDEAQGTEEDRNVVRDYGRDAFGVPGVIDLDDI